MLKSERVPEERKRSALVPIFKKRAMGRELATTEALRKVMIWEQQYGFKLGKKT